MQKSEAVQRRPRLRLRLTGPAERQIRLGHPWVYDSGIRQQNRDGQTGELAVIYDRKNEFLAIGLYDAESVIRVRVLHHGSPVTIDPSWWQQRLEAALVRRKGLFDESTTGYRIINGESDGWPGLVMDKYGGCLVIKLYTASWMPRLEEVVYAIREACSPEHLVLRLSRNIRERASSMFNLRDGQMLHGNALQGPVVFLENGVRFEADVVRGQKTGFFLDQRENRKRIGEMAARKNVLNAFSFSGGFSLYAAKNGAASVLDLDISKHALESSKRNHDLNADDANVRACAREWVQADVFDWLAGSDRKFDIVILDPPSLAKREAEREGALRAYSKLAALGAARVCDGGMLVAFSCSAHVSETEFFQAALEGAKRSARFETICTADHAADHPVIYPEGKYLKGIYLRRT